MKQAAKEVQGAERIPSLQDRAIENLEYIRGTMERSTEFTAVPGYGGALMGLTAIGTAVIASMQASVQLRLVTWLTDALLAFMIGVLAVWQKSRAADTPFDSLPARKFALGFAPPVIAAVILTGALVLQGSYGFLPAVWITCYGAAVVTGGAFSVRPVQVMGWTFLAAGAVTAFLPQNLGNVMMGVCFGAVHLAFGILIGRKYGG